MASGIYKITNKINGCIYVGSAVNITHRWECHISDLNKNKHHSAHLQRAWLKYGASAFEFSVIEECGKDNLIEREQIFIDALAPSYNIAKKAGSNFGVSPSQETRNKISNSTSIRFSDQEERDHMASVNTGRRYSQEYKDWLADLRRERARKERVLVNGGSQ